MAILGATTLADVRGVVAINRHVVSADESAVLIATADRGYERVPISLEFELHQRVKACS
jgi:hypothetical protein